MAQALALLIGIAMLSGCSLVRHRSEIVTQPDGMRVYTEREPLPGERKVCRASAVVDPVVGTLQGDPTAAEPVWLQDADGRRLSVVWPDGFHVRFEPDVVLYLEDVPLVRSGRLVTLAQVPRGSAHGTSEDPYVASGLFLDLCFHYTP